jgi:hypothetical protein
MAASFGLEKQSQNRPSKSHLIAVAVAVAVAGDKENHAVQDRM